MKSKSQKKVSKTEGSPILTVDDLMVSFGGKQRRALAVDGATFSLYPGETLAIVGESGCGKTVTAMSILQLIPSPPGRIDTGVIYFDGNNLAKIGKVKLQQVRGNDIAMIFQEPMTSLNPVITIGRQLTESMRLHKRIPKKEAEERAVELLRLVQIPEPEKRMRQYPHQMSGGMRQRVLIAIALSCNPRVIIADEPTTALDVTVQAQILDLMSDIKEKFGTAIIFITHDLGVVAEIAERVLFMYTGRVIEEAPVEEIFETPLHPYSQGLLSAVPRLDVIMSHGTERPRLQQMQGMVPSIYQKIEGCSFAPRCSYAQSKCEAERPRLVEVRMDHRVACWEVHKWL